MWNKRLVPEYRAWCILCRWQGEPRKRFNEPALNQEFKLHYREFHLPESKGHRPNGHGSPMLTGWSDDCVCGGYFRFDVSEDCVNARRF